MQPSVEGTCSRCAPPKTTTFGTPGPETGQPKCVSVAHSGLNILTCVLHGPGVGSPILAFGTGHPKQASHHPVGGPDDPTVGGGIPEPGPPPVGHDRRHAPNPPQPSDVRNQGPRSEPSTVLVECAPSQVDPSFALRRPPAGHAKSQDRDIILGVEVNSNYADFGESGGAPQVAPLVQFARRDVEAFRGDGTRPCHATPRGPR